MPVHLVEVRPYPDRFCAEVIRDRLDHDPEDEVTTSVHDTPPVILAGMVKGGEIATVAEYEMSPTLPRHFFLLVDASGRVIADRAGVGRALRTGAFPLTWYLYPEAP